MRIQRIMLLGAISLGVMVVAACSTVESSRGSSTTSGEGASGSRFTEYEFTQAKSAYEFTTSIAGSVSLGGAAESLTEAPVDVKAAGTVDIAVEPSESGTEFELTLNAISGDVSVSNSPAPVEPASVGLETPIVQLVASDGRSESSSAAGAALNPGSEVIRGFVCPVLPEGGVMPGQSWTSPADSTLIGTTDALATNSYDVEKLPNGGEVATFTSVVEAPLDVDVPLALLLPDFSAVSTGLASELEEISARVSGDVQIETECKIDLEKKIIVSNTMSGRRSTSLSVMGVDGEATTSQIGARLDGLGLNVEFETTLRLSS